LQRVPADAVITRQHEFVPVNRDCPMLAPIGSWSCGRHLSPWCPVPRPRLRASPEGVGGGIRLRLGRQAGPSRDAVQCEKERSAMLFSKTALVPALLVLATVCGAQGLGSRDDEIAIRTVIVEMTDGFNRHDAAAATRMYKPDADFVSVRGEVGIGRDAAERGLRRIFETRAKAAMLKTEEVRIRFIRPDVALAHVTNELSGLVAPDGQTLPSHRELSLRIFVKDDGVWRVASFHNTMLSPFTGGAPRP
jgi:uncharacterized protein (TIGR02246 family)